MSSREVPCDECGIGVLAQDAVLIESSKSGNIGGGTGCAEAGELITEAMAEEADDREPERPGGMTPEAEHIAQSKDPVDFSELDWHITSPQAEPGKPDSQCELGSCESEATHHVELLKMRVAKKKKFV